jgi:hypothetical protein
MTAFNRPTKLELGRFGNILWIIRKRGASRAEFRDAELKQISSASFRRLMQIFEDASNFTHTDGDIHEYRLLGRFSVEQMTHLNDYGVEVSDDLDIPCCCFNCPLFEGVEYGYDDQVWAAPYCKASVFFPRRKGTCQTKERIMALKPVAGWRERMEGNTP